MSGPQRRDRTLARVRILGWGVGLGAALATGGLSVAAAHAFKGHSGKAAPATAVRDRPLPRVHVPPPQHVPSISGEPPPLLPPEQPPAAAQEQAPPPEPVSGGS